VSEARILDPDLFDETPEQDDLYGFELQDGLSEEEVGLGMQIVKWGLLRGVAIVTGPVGSGKDLLGHAISWVIKRCFKDRKVLKDEKPRALFGYYEPFNTMTVVQELIEKLPEVMPGEIARQDIKLYKRMENLANQWLDGGGEQKLAGGVLYLTEFWKYMLNRSPFSPMGILLGAILKRWRHLDLLVIGNAPRRHELDRFTCLPYVTTEIRCRWAGADEAIYRIFRTTYIGSQGILKVVGKPKQITIDGGEPRDFLGGKRFFDLFVSKSRSSTSFGGGLQKRMVTRL